LASTAPGKKLWLNFDPDGIDSLRGREDIKFVNMAGANPMTVVTQAITEGDPFRLTNLIESLGGVDTIVVDSLTMLADMALLHAARSKGLKEDEPGQRGYAVRNRNLLKFIHGMLTMAQRTTTNVIFIAHEGQLDKNADGVVLGASLALSSGLATNISAIPSEVWHVRDADGKRMISIRPCRQRAPMGSRMFDTSGAPEFLWRYDPVKGGDGIAQWFEAWQKGGGKKLQPPS
jgi:hypothetical protein